jgi:hypothetical protein
MRVLITIGLVCVIVYAPTLLASERDCYKRGGVLKPSPLGGLVCMKKPGRIPLPPETRQ